jgi:hypothetical protein
MGILLLYCMLYIGINYHMASNLERGTRSNEWMDGWLGLGTNRQRASLIKMQTLIGPPGS